MFSMDAAQLLLPFLLAILFLSDEVSGESKSTKYSPFRQHKPRDFCVTCKVVQKVGNHTVNPRRKVILKCAFDGVSSKNISWFKNGLPLKQNRRVKSIAWDKNGVKLRIKSATGRDKGWYSCEGRNNQGLKITSDGYVRVRQSLRTKTQPPTYLPMVHGRCETYKGGICSPYINYLIFVDTSKPEKSQEFLETMLTFGYDRMRKNMSSTCKPLPLWCHYNFPECYINKANARPKLVCKKDCEAIATRDCKAEYSFPRRTRSDSDGSDLFPDCNTLPGTRNCIALGDRKRRPVSPRIGNNDDRTGGKCVRYSGNYCKNKIGKKVFVPLHAEIADIELDIVNSVHKINTSGLLTKKCSLYIEPLLCHLRLPECDKKSAQPRGKPICKDECFVLKKKYCRKEYSSLGNSPLVFDCSSVFQLHDSGQCSAIGLPKSDLNDPRLFDEENDVSSQKSRVGYCAPYSGKICADILEKKRNIFVDTNNAQQHVETKLENALESINKFQKLTDKCRPFVLPLMCHHLFPYCDPTSSSTQPKPTNICRRDCLHIQHNICPTEYEIAVKELPGDILFPSCFDLKAYKVCIPLRKYNNKNKTGPIPGDCYTGTGASYRGYANTTESGANCENWDIDHDYPREKQDLLGGHNYCRNPGGKREKPWCLTADPKRRVDWCNLPKCVESGFNGTAENYMGTLNKTVSGKTCEPWFKHDKTRYWFHNYCRNPGGSKQAPWCYVGEKAWEYCENPEKVRAKESESARLSTLLYTVLPCVVFGLVVGTVIIAVCWRHHKQGPDLINKKPPPTETVFLPELRTIPSENLTLAKSIGKGRFGAIYTAEIRSFQDSNHVNRLVKVSLKEQRDEFINQAKIWSQFHHPNILGIEAMSSSDDPVTLIFEAAPHGSLYQYLIHHSPNNPKFTRDHALLLKENLVDISRQVAAGMTYLSSHGYIHGDIMTRNCQMAHSMIIKITDFSIDRDVCYYNRPNKRPTPIGWMAPETIQTEIFTVYSDVWAFGVLMWEIFTYGFQPYFGYTFAEVKKKVMDLEYLERPRGCGVVVYDLMKKCWHKNPLQRPHFFDLHEILNNLSKELAGQEQQDMHYCVASSSC